MLTPDQKLQNLRTGFNARFQRGLKEEPDNLDVLVEEVNSTAALETYGFLGDMPMWRRWLGERRLAAIKEKAYQLINEKFEVSTAVAVDAIADDNLGLWPNVITGWGRNAQKLRAMLIAEALSQGHTRECYDGQNFFDTDHPVGDGTASNMSAAGAAQPWFLLDCSQMLRPIIHQKRLDPQFAMVMNPADSKVFLEDQYMMGAKARGASGYTYWQMAYRSTQTLNAANYIAARDAMMALKNDVGEPLEIMPTHIVVGVSNWQAAKDLFQKPNLTGGESNTLNGEVAVQLLKRLS